MDSMTDDDASLPIDFNGSTQVVPGLMDTDMTARTFSNETGVAGTGKFSEVHTMKDHEMLMSELKKENFDLKLRIYFLEKKLQHFERGSDDDGFKMNIEMKVEIEKLKSELKEKQRLIAKARSAVDSLDRNNREQIKKMRDQHNQDVNQIKQTYEVKMVDYEKLLNNANNQTDTLTSKLQEVEWMNRKTKEDFSKPGFSAAEATEMQAKLQASLREKDRIIDELKVAVDVRESRIKQNESDAAGEQIKGMTQKVEERDLQILDLKEKLRRAELSVKDLRRELHENERKFQQTAQTNNSFAQKLNEKLHLKQTELDEVQEKFRILQQNLEKAQDIIDEASLKDVEAFEEKSQALKAKDALIAELQGNVKQREMENDHLTRSVGKKDVELQRMSEEKSMREKAEQKIQQKEEELTALTEQLVSEKNKLREAIDKFEEQLQKINLDHQKQLFIKDQIIHRATETLEEKESIIQDLIVTQENLSMSSSLDDITDTKEDLIQKLRDRLKERDAVVEANIEEKFQALHKKEEELQELRKGLRDRDRLIENINTAVLQREDTVKNLQLSIGEKSNLVNELKLNLQNQRKQFEEANEIALKRSRENEGLVEKLKRNLSNREQQIENLKTVLQRNASKEAKDIDENDLVNELSNILKQKEQMLSDVLAERSQMIALNETNTQKMLNTLTGKENLLQEMSEKTERLCSEKNANISRLQQQVNNLNLEIHALENSKLWSQQEHEILLGKVRQSLLEKDRTIEKLINSGKEKDKVFVKLQECTTNKKTSPVRLELSSLQNTIQDLQSELQEKQDLIERLQKDSQDNELRNSAGNEMKVNLQNTIRELQNELQEQQGVIDRLRNAIHENTQQSNPGNEYENLEYTAELELELEQKDSLLKQAADTIEAFQAKLNNLPVLEEMKKNLEDTKRAFNESEVQRNKLQKDMQNLREQESRKVQSLQNENTLLKKQRDAWLLQHKTTAKQPEDQVKRLGDLLQEQIQETSLLRQMLQREIEAYENIVNQADRDGNNLTKLDEELEVISKLRRSLEDGIEQNNHLRAELQEKITTEHDLPNNMTQASQEEEVKRLHAKLEESERWNMSLQSRLDALQPRARGVGGSTGNLTLLGNSGSTPIADDVEVATKLRKQLEEHKSRLDESQKLNSRLRGQLEKMAQNKPGELSGQNRLNEQQKQEITLLREELQKANNVSDELRTAVKKADWEMSSYKREHEREFNSLKKALEDSQKVILALQGRLNEVKEGRERQMLHDSGSHTESGGAVDERSLESPRRRQIIQLQKELEEMYRKNEELRRNLSGDMQLNELNRQIKQDLVKAQQNNTTLVKQLENNAKKLQEMMSEVTRLSSELNRAHALCMNYATQLKTLRSEGEKSERLGKDVASDGNEKLKSEIQRLRFSLEEVEKENEQLKEQAIEKTHDTTPTTSRLSDRVHTAKGLDSTDATSSAELQSLRKKLDAGEKLSTALKYELEVNKKSANKSEASGDPLMGHLEELRHLRSRLEEGIKTYDALCVQLEEKLTELNDGAEDGVKDRLSLAKANDDLRAQLVQFTEKMKKIQTQLEEQRIAGKKDKEQLSLVHNQLVESNKSNESLRKELAIYDRVLNLQDQRKNNDGSSDVTNSGSTNNDAILLLMTEIRSLRKQLEASIHSNNSLRQMLQNQSSPPRQPGARSPVRGLGTKASPVSPPVSYRSSPVLGEKRSDEREVNVVLESETLEGLRQYVNSSFHNSESLLIKMTKLTVEGQDKQGHFDDIKRELEALRSLLFKSNKLLDRLWAEQLSSGPTVADRLTQQNAELQKEITMLKRRVLSQSKILENTATRLESSSRMRKEVERSLFARLSETRETLGSSRKNLQDRVTARSDTENNDVN